MGFNTASTTLEAGTILQRKMYLKLGFLTITCLVCLVASTPQYYDEGYYDPNYQDRANPSYGQYDPGYSQYSGLTVRSVKPEKNQGTLPNRKSDSSTKRPTPVNGQSNPLNEQAYPPNAGANGQAHPQGGSRIPNGQGFPNAGNDFGFDAGAFPNGPSYSSGGSKKPGFESHYSDTQHYKGSQGRVNYETNIQNNFHYVENTERNFYVIPSSGAGAGGAGPRPANNKANKNKQDKNKSFSWW